MRNKKKKRNERKKTKKGKQCVERKERKMRKEEREREDFPTSRRSKLDGLRTKVGTRSATYVWTPKTWSFDKLHKVGNFPTRFIFNLKVI